LSRPSAPPAIEPIGPLVDTHAHLDDPRLAQALDEVLSRACTAGVEQILAIGTTADSSHQVVSIAAAHPGVFSVVGIQPNHVAEARPGDWDRVAALARSRPPSLVALGETGLDRYWDHTPFDQQQDYFDRHLRLAAELDLPVVIHCRDCEADIIAQLSALGRPVRGVLHSFTGHADHARAFLDLGLYISLAGMITFSNPTLDPLRAAARTIPLDRLLVETDSPYLSPHPFRGRPNEPARVAVTASYLARLLEVSPLELTSRTAANARALFRLTDSVLPLNP
jgi:TatD DNase family protein